MINRLTFLLILLISLRGEAQYLQTVKFSKEETKLYDPIKGVYEDDKGYIWVYGLDGVSRYNGQRFETLEELYPEASMLQVKTCFSLLKSHDMFWIGTSTTGLFGFDAKGRLKNFEDLIKGGKQLNSSRILGLHAYKDLLLILGEEGVEIFHKNGKLFERLEIPLASTEAVMKTFVHNDALWLSDNEGIWKLDLTNFEISNKFDFPKASFFTSPNGKLWLSSLDEGSRFSYFSEGANEWILNPYQPYLKHKLPRQYSWLGDDKLISFGQTDLFVQVTDFKQENIEHIDEVESGLGSEKFIRGAYRDRQGRKWLYGNEVYLLPTKGHISTEWIIGQDDEVLDMVVLPSKVIASIRNKGLVVYDKLTETKTFLHPENSALADNFISQLVDFGDGRIGLCMMNYFQIYDEGNGFGKAYELPGIIRSAYEAPNCYWVGGYKSLFKIDKVSGHVKEIKKNTRFRRQGSAINDIFPLGSESLLIVTTNDMIMKFDLADEAFDNSYELRNMISIGLDASRNIDADISPSGNRIATATDNGILYIENGKRTKLPMKSTSFSNVVFYTDSILYATSKNEIYRINLDKKEVRTFDKLKGISNNYFAMRSSYRDQDGNIYLGGDHGIDKISEVDYQPSIKDFSLKLDQLFYNGRPQFPEDDDSYKVPSNVQVIELKVNSPRNFTLDAFLLQTKFSSETDWETLSSNESFTLYNPSPGKMTPKFRFIDHNGQVTSEELSVNMFVQQIWYKKPLLWVLSMIFLSVLAASLFSRYNKKKSDRKLRNIKLQEELASLKLTSLNAQMNPHFIFNALSSIQHLIASNDTEVAEEYLSKFSKLLRHVIQYASHENVSLAQEEAFIKNYLALELLRFDKAFTYEIKNDVEEADRLMIPPFFIQPQIENAIKHGLLAADKIGHISIHFKESGKRVLIAIEDNGIGRKEANKQKKLSQESTKKGDFLTKERIANLNKLNYKSSYLVEDLVGNGNAKGTRVTLTFENEDKDLI